MKSIIHFFNRRLILLPAFAITPPFARNRETANNPLSGHIGYTLILRFLKGKM
jgi:hypothetical protein